jgi:hypothetical protein
MTRNTRLITLGKLIILVCVLSIFAALPAFAGMLILNGNYQISLNPGESFNHTATLHIDPNDLPMNFSVAVYDVKQGLDGYIQINNELEENYIYTAKSFINVSPSHFHLEPGSSQDITITGALPTEIKGGGRYAAIYAESNSMEKGNMKIKLAAQIPVTITVLGDDVNYSGEISNFLIDHPASTKQQNISFLFTNTGNCHYKVKIESLLKNKAGTILASTSEPLSFDPVLPLFSMLLKTSLVQQKKLNPGAYYVDVKVRLEDDTILASKVVEFKAT